MSGALAVQLPYMSGNDAVDLVWFHFKIARPGMAPPAETLDDSDRAVGLERSRLHASVKFGLNEAVPNGLRPARGAGIRSISASITRTLLWPADTFVRSLVESVIDPAIHTRLSEDRYP